MTWAIENKGYSQRRACGLIGMEPRVYRYRSSRPDDLGLRRRLRELAGERRRFGYRRLHLLLKRNIPLRPRRQLLGVDALGDVVVVGRRGDRQHLADRLDPVRLAVIVYERDHRLNGRSSSAWAK